MTNLAVWSIIEHCLPEISFNIQSFWKNDFDTLGNLHGKSLTPLEKSGNPSGKANVTVIP